MMDLTYSSSRGEIDLARWVPSPVDGAIAEAIRDRGRLDVPCDSLVTFARRRSVQALRERKPDLAEQAVMALAGIDHGHCDRRDIGSAASLARHVLWRLGGDVDGVDTVRRSLAACGFAEVVTEHGLGLVERWSDPYAPHHDLAAIAVEAADIVDSLGYMTNTIAVATSLPAVWFARERVAPSRPGAVRGCARVSARLHNRPLNDPLSQILTVFLADARDAGTAAHLRYAAEPLPMAKHAALALARGSMFCLVIGRSAVDDRPNQETPASLRRFDRPLHHLLDRHLGTTHHGDAEVGPS